MRAIKIFVTVLIIMLFGCQPISIPDESQKPDVENTEQNPEKDNPEEDNPEDEESGENENPEQGEEPDTPTTPEQPQESYYVKVAQSFSDWSGDYLITYTSSSEIKVFDSFSGSDKGTSNTDLKSSLTVDGIHSSTGDTYKAIVTKSGDGYTVYLTNVGYIGLESSGNKVHKTTTTPSSSDTKYQWTFSYKSGGSVWMTNVAYSSRRLQWNESASCFRCYEGSQKDLTFYPAERLFFCPLGLFL